MLVNSQKEIEKKSELRQEELLAYLEKRIKELEKEEKKFRRHALNKDKN